MNFEDFLQQKNIIPKTISRHQREIKKYVEWLACTHGKIPEVATKKDLLEYLKYIKEKRKLVPATQSRILLILKNFYAYLAKEYQTKDITRFIKIRGANRQYLPSIFTPDELDLLCDAYYSYIQEYKPNNRELNYHPNYDKFLQGRYITLTLMAYQGLTLLEIENLTQNDFDLRKGVVSIRKSLRNAARILPLEALQIGSLLQYYADGEDTPLMPNRNDFEALSKSLKKIYPNFFDFRQIRSSKIIHWLKIYGLRKTQHMAGHRYISSTEKYLASEIETLHNDMNNFHPLN
jgi:integrase/recombinase XerD